jgi:protein SCO1/2
MAATLTNSEAKKPGLMAKLVSSKLFWFLAVGFFFSYPIIKSVKRELPNPLPVLGQVPEFVFTDENNKSFGSRDLKGKVYIANFIFTSCQTVCPVLLNKLQKVQHRLRGVMDRAAIVSFTVDPVTDTPEVLLAKSMELKAKPSVWRFLTAPLEETKQLLVDGFKVPVGEKEIAGNIMDVAHSNKFVLVDQLGRIRGYYSSDDEGINHLMIDTGLLINQKTI